jgi:hypothetical protein
VQFLENKFAAILADLNAMLAQLAKASIANAAPAGGERD